MVLKQATSTEAIARDKLTFFEWGTKLTLEQYLAREQRLRKHDWARRELKTWLLLDDGGEVLSSCETLAMRSLVQVGEAWAQGVTHGFASVFTEERLRGKGHAGELIKRVCAELEGEGVHSFILFSEVGEGMYKRVGFEARPSFDRVFTCNATKTAHPELRLLTRAQALLEWERQIPLPRERFLVWPTSGQLDWHFEREDAYATLLHGKLPTFHGAALDQSLAIWMMDHKNDCLTLLCLRSRTTLEAQVLVTKACEVARELGTDGVRVWESDAFQGWDRLGHSSRRVARDNALAMIRPASPLLKASDWNFIPRGIWL